MWLFVRLKQLQGMKNLDAGSFQKLNFAHTALRNDGIDFSVFEQLKECIAHRHREFVAQQAGFQAESTTHAATRAGFDKLYFCTAPSQPLNGTVP